MKFVKSNLDLLISGLVVLLAVGFCFWPLGSWNDQYVTAAKTRLTKKDTATGLIYTKSKPLVIPGYGPVPGPSDEVSAITLGDSLIEAKREASDKMKKVAERIREKASEDNWKKRVVLEHPPAGPKGQPPRVVPLLSDRREDNYLPLTHGQPMAFKADYLGQFPKWNAKLGYVPMNLTQEIQDRQKAFLLQKQRNALAGGGPATGGGPSNVGSLTQEEMSRIAKGVILNRAASIKIYVDDEAIQKRTWATAAAPPNELEIFEGLVDSWLINDVVNAIVELNDEVLSKQPERHVGRSAVKRLQGIVIGSANTPGSGGIFVGMNAAALAVGGGQGGGPSPVGGSGYAVSFTGHTSNNDYDVVSMTIRIVIDPAYENKFFDYLYRQNNGYTVLNVKTKAVDPMDTAATGYIYGDTQCVELEIQVENIMFRTWTLPLMPPTLRQAMNLPPLPATR